MIAEKAVEVSRHVKLEPNSASPEAFGSPDPRVLVITVEPWETAARFIYELKKAGFTVGAIAPRRHITRRANVADACYLHSASMPLRSIRRTIRQWQPDYLFCTDDRAVNLLHQFYAKKDGAASAPGGFCQLIERSLGDPASYSIVTSKTKTLALAKSMGLRCPRTIVVNTEDILEKEIANRSYPLVVKADGYYGGWGIRVVKSAEAARGAFRDFKVPLRWNRVLKTVARTLPSGMLRKLTPRPPTIALQDYIEGRNANCSLACWQGEVLAGLSVESICILNETGPSTVVRVIDNREMSETARALVRELSVSGFFGFDFIIDSLNRTWLLEINPRVTPISHLVCETDLIGAIRRRINDSPERPRACIRQDLIALFPQEWRRNPKSEYIHSAFHDVPWEHPSLVRTLLV